MFTESDNLHQELTAIFDQWDDWPRPDETSTLATTIITYLRDRGIYA